jgi:hypothetical protein
MFNFLHFSFYALLKSLNLSFKPFDIGIDMFFIFIVVLRTWKSSTLKDVTAEKRFGGSSGYTNRFPTRVNRTSD